MTAETGRPSSIRLWAPWIAMAVVVVLALAIGTFAQGEPTKTERAQQLATTIRCPSCKSQSAASSDTPSSQAVRSLIKERIDAGDTDEQIRDFVASRYGREILLDPSGSGFGTVVWALPVILVIVAVAGLAIRFRDWRPGDRQVTQADRDLVAQALNDAEGEADGDSEPEGDPEPESEPDSGEDPEPDGEGSS